MGWIEILAIIFATAVVLLPIILYIVRRKKGKKASSCSCGCNVCPYSSNCGRIDKVDKTDSG